jgi:antitoxin (DNA-binding transcriptional repressor) of toxin-antitoxin stability system
MTAHSVEPGRLGPQQHNQFFGAGGSNVANSYAFIPDPVLLDPRSRAVEMPTYSTIFEYLRRLTAAGSSIYITRSGEPVFAVVPVAILEALEEDDERDRQADLQDLLNDSEARMGPVPAEVAAEVDRQWRAAAAL